MNTWQPAMVLPASKVTCTIHGPLLTDMPEDRRKVRDELVGKRVRIRETNRNTFFKGTLVSIGDCRPVDVEIGDMLAAAFSCEFLID